MAMIFRTNQTNIKPGIIAVKNFSDLKDLAYIFVKLRLGSWMDISVLYLCIKLKISVFIVREVIFIERKTILKS